MNHQDTHHQAEQLEKIFKEVKNHEDTYNNLQSTAKSQDLVEESPEIDVLNLPPRSEVHNSAEQSWKFKLNKATWRLIIVSLILLIITIVILYDVLYLQRTILFTKPFQLINHTVEIFLLKGR